MKNLFKFSFWAVALLWCSIAQAQSIEIDATTRIVESITSEKTFNHHEISKKLSSLEENLKSGSYKVDTLSTTVKELSSIREQLGDGRKQTEKELQFVQKRIEALGEEATDEIDTISEKRKEFNDEASLLKAQIAEIDVMSAKIDELDIIILNIRNQALIGNLLVQQSPLIVPQNFLLATSSFVTFTLDIIRSPINWYQNLDEGQRSDIHQKFIPGTLTFLLLLWLAIYLRLFLNRHFGYNDNIRPRFGKKVIAAVLVSLAYGVIPAILIAGFMAWLYGTKIVDGSFFGIVLNHFLFYLLLIFVTKALTRVVFTPYHPRWRLVDIDTTKAKKITQTLYLAIVLICTCSCLSTIAISANYSMDLISFLTVISSAVKGIFIIWLTKILLLDDVTSTDDEDDDEIEDSVQAAALSRKIKMSFLIIMAVIIIFTLSLFGYARLSGFIFNRLILSTLLVGALFLIRKLLSEFMHHMLFFKFWFNTFRVRRKVRMSIDFWVNMVLDPLFILLGIFLLLSLWGVSTDLLLQSLKKLFTGFKIGGINISLIAIALGVGSFFAALAFFKMLRNRFFNQVLAKMNIDDGIRHSLSSGLGFIGFVFAAIIGITIMGVDLTNLAIIASALSVGIGFGLQNVINNFVSGIIILFERPFKVGDWVVFNGEEGKIKQINIRSTEIETFKRSSIIVPNATLISSAVTNLTHENNWSRQSLTVGVAYGTDVEKVKEILLDVARHHKLVLKNPAPYVLFKDFGASSLDFDLRCYTSNLWEGWTIPSDLRFEIYKRFNEEGIEIPFQQIVLHQCKD
ncbi:MAG: mechanosensitive ion channel family protein [Alphaproteobacteria bacterium]|nr:mechanosensitive ion channel family protein [Alphaproteobacteria bacterium]